MTRKRITVRRIDVGGVAHATVPDFARLRGVTPQTVRERIDRNRIPFVAIDGKTLIPIEEASDAWDISKLTNTNGQAERQARKRGEDSKKTKSGSTWTLQREGQATKLWNEGLLKELEYRQKCGELVEVSKVQKELGEIAAVMRRDLETFADRTHMELAALQDPDKVYRYLSDEIRRIMENFSNGKSSRRPKTHAANLPKGAKAKRSADGERVGGQA